MSDPHKDALHGFILGLHYPDWFADAVTANAAITVNLDGRHRGGPDVAYLWTPTGIKIARSGDWVIWTKHETFDVVPAAGVKLPPQPDEAREGSHEQASDEVNGTTSNPSFSKAEGRTP